jgi:hypothetical protein
MRVGGSEAATARNSLLTMIRSLSGSTSGGSERAGGRMNPSQVGPRAAVRRDGNPATGDARLPGLCQLFANTDLLHKRGIIPEQIFLSHDALLVPMPQGRHRQMVRLSRRLNDGAIR